MISVFVSLPDHFGPDEIEKWVMPWQRAAQHVVLIHAPCGTSWSRAQQIHVLRESCHAIVLIKRGSLTTGQKLVLSDFPVIGKVGRYIHEAALDAPTVTDINTLAALWKGARPSDGAVPAKHWVGGRG